MRFNRRLRKQVAILGGKLKYLLNDDFLTALTAGNVDGTAAEPGPGTRAVVDAESKLTLASGDLVFSGGKSSPAFGDPGLALDAVTRASGVFFAFQGVVTNGVVVVGWHTIQGGTPSRGAFYYAGTDLKFSANGSKSVAVIVQGEEYQLVSVLRAAGAFAFIKGGTFTDWTMLYACRAGTETPLYPNFSNYNGSARFRFGRIYDGSASFLPSPTVSDSFTRSDGSLGSSDGLGHQEANGGSGYAWQDTTGTWAISSNKAAASALDGGLAFATVDSEETDVLAEVSVTRSGGVVGLVLRYVDASNYVVAYYDGTNVKVDKVVGGTTTNVVSQARSYSAGAQLAAAWDGTGVFCWYNDTIGGSATVDDGVFTDITRHGIYTTDTGNRLDDFVTWTRRGSGYTPLNRYFFSVDNQTGVFVVGDSKSTAGYDWFTQLRDLVYEPSVLHIVERPDRFAIGGYTAAQMHTYVDTNLAAADGDAGIILINLGANDVSGLPAEATWKADMVGIIDPIRSKWTSSNVYIMRPWRRSYASECDTLATWIAEIIATYPSGVLAGPDERDWLENGDDGATMTSDGTHYSAAGNAEAANQWDAVITA